MRLDLMRSARGSADRYRAEARSRRVGERRRLCQRPRKRTCKRQCRRPMQLSAWAGLQCQVPALGFIPEALRCYQRR